MLKKILNHLRKPFDGVPMHARVLRDNKGVFSILGGANGSTSQTDSTQRTERAPSKFVQQPDYPEAEAARKGWWEKLQEFGGQPGYGAIAPDWGNIWENAQKKVQQYFWGSPTDPGVIGKIRSSAAGRNVSESPALETMISRMGATEGDLLSSMATEQATKEAEFAEGGRQNWLQQMTAMAGMNPQGSWYTPWTQTTGKTTGKTSGWNIRAKVGKA